MRRRSMLVVVGIGVGIGSAGALAQPKDLIPVPEGPANKGRMVDLRPRFKAGQEIKLALESTERSKPAGGGDAGEGAQTMSQSFDLTLKVREAQPEKGSKVDLRFDSMKMSGALAGVKFDFDSSRPAEQDDAMGSLLRTMVGTTLALELDANGNVTGVTGEGVGSLGSALAGGDVNAASLLGSMLGPIRGEGDSGRHSVGESWTTSSQMMSPAGSWTLVSTSTLRSAGGGKADIAIRGDVRLEGGTQVKIDRSSYEGTAQWDTEEGFLRSLETRLDVSYTRLVEGDRPDAPRATPGTLERRVKVRRR